MAVSSYDPDDDFDDDKPTGPAVFSARRLARQQNGFERFVAVLLLLVSILGSLLAGGGGANAWLALQPFLWGALAAGVLQGVLSYVQYIYALYGFRAWQYTLAIAVSSALTIAGYWQLAHPWITGLLVGWQVPKTTAEIVAGAVLFIAAVGVDIFPEKTLVQ